RIVGIREKGQAMDVHAIECPKLAEYEDEEQAWRDLSWSAEAERNAIATTRVTATVRNAPGVLGEVCSIIGEAGGNIVNLRMHHRQQDFFDVDFDIDVKDARHLTLLIAALRANPSVDTVDRAMG
ncbi:MAG TPA: ACT domain-containing protein, partial [Candidatus Limnocylindria bacterium]|nr:ACT domain-containing protein [Candidatus Limnocylindria bacterium]